jgi:hypothetical protein
MRDIIKKILKESNDFEWADIDPSTLHKPYVGMKFRTKNNPNSVYEIFDISSSIVYYKYTSNQTGREVKSSIPIIYFNRYMKDGDWVTHYVNEDFDWTDSISPETEWDKDKYYVLDITSLSGLKLRETIDDIWDFAYNMDYDVEIGVQYNNVGYIYFEPNDEVPEGYALDWSPRKTTDPTFNGRYQMLTLKEFYHMAYGDEPSMNEDFDWTESVPNPGQYDIFDLNFLITTNGVKLGDKVHLKGHAKDIDVVFDNVGTVVDVIEYNNKYLCYNMPDELEYAIKIKFDDNLLHGRGYRGTSLEEYELRDTFADQEDLTFDLLY